MNPETLLHNLLRLDDEDEVDELLTRCGYPLSNEQVWSPLGGFENNFSTVGNQHSEATGAFVEKVINGIDAILMREAFRAGVEPQGASAPPSMATAIEDFLGIKGGRLDRLDAKQLTALADDLHVVATGSKLSPSYLIVDRGEGQAPEKFPETFLSLNRSNKMRIPFVQGKFNSGGTAVLQFCGFKNMQLILSKRNPSAPIEPGHSRDLWGFTIVRRRRPRPGERVSIYVYLAPGGSVLTVPRTSIEVLPEKRTNLRPDPYSTPLTSGTCIKLYNFRWRAKSIATTEVRYELERFLHAPCLPFRITETRDYKANYYSTTLSGIWASIGSGDEQSESTKVEPGFPDYSTLDLRGIGSLPYRTVVFKQEVHPRHVPHGVFFTINGQVHGELPADFVSRTLKYDYLKDHLLVSVDCTGMDDAVREDFFLASRDRIRKNEIYESITEHLKEALREHQGLRELNAARRRRDIEKAISNEDETIKVFNELLRTDPTLGNLFSLGDRLVTKIGPGNPVPFMGKKFPSFFRLSKSPVGGLVKRCPINKTCRVEFETDASNDYFERFDSPGTLSTNPPNLIEHSHLWNGRFTAHFRVPWDLKAGQEVDVNFTVADVESDRREQPFVSTFKLIAEPEVSREAPPGPTVPPHNRPKTNGKSASPSLALPQIHDVHKPDEPYNAIEVRHDEKEGYEFFLNLDNTFLLTELTKSRDDDRNLVLYWFKYGLALCALGMLQENRRVTENKGETSGAEMDLTAVNNACNGIARTIVPIVRALYRGPNREAAVGS